MTPASQDAFRRSLEHAGNAENSMSSEWCLAYATLAIYWQREGERRKEEEDAAELYDSFGVHNQ